MQNKRRLFSWLSTALALFLLFAIILNGDNEVNIIRKGGFSFFFLQGEGGLINQGNLRNGVFMKQAFLEANIRSNRIEVPGATLEHKKAIQSKFGDQASVTLKEDGLLKIRPIKTDLLELALSIGESDSGILVPTDDIPIEKYCST